jgi:hypothetical protein
LRMDTRRQGFVADIAGCADTMPKNAAATDVAAATSVAEQCSPGVR